MADADPEPLTDEAAAAMVAVLHRHGVRFVVIGGFAIQLHQVEGLARTSGSAHSTSSLKPSGTDGYDDLIASAVEFPVANTMMITASLDDIIRSKTAAGSA